MLPPRRLTALLDQAVAYQVDQCVYHNTGDGPCQKTGWATDNSCSKETFPCETIQVLMDHGDEVWYCKWSPNGRSVTDHERLESLMTVSFQVFGDRQQRRHSHHLGV